MKIQKFVLVRVFIKLSTSIMTHQTHSDLITGFEMIIKTEEMVILKCWDNNNYKTSCSNHISSILITRDYQILLIQTQCP